MAAVDFSSQCLCYVTLYLFDISMGFYERALIDKPQVNKAKHIEITRMEGERSYFINM